MKWHIPTGEIASLNVNDERGYFVAKAVDPSTAIQICAEHNDNVALRAENVRLRHELLKYAENGECSGCPDFRKIETKLTEAVKALQDIENNAMHMGAGCKNIEEQARNASSALAI